MPMGWGPSATSGSYSPSAAELGTILRVQASYTDGDASAENAVSVGVLVANYSHTLNENTKAVTTVAVSDTLLGTSPRFSLSGADAAIFKVSSKGALKFVAAPDYEVPTDTNYSGVYNVSVTMTNARTLYAVTQDLVIGVGLAPLEGTSGNDTLRGTKGWDTLDGKAGDDKLTGGGGLDTFRISAGYDRVADFNALGKT